MKCQAHKTTCRKEGCGFKYKGEYRGTLVCPQCGTPRQPCALEAVDGYNFCEHHGGPNPKHNYYGNAGQIITTGKKSQFQLTRLAGKYIEMREDGRLLSNRASLEVVRERIRELAERIDLNHAPDRLKNIKNLWEKYKQSVGLPDNTAYQNALDEEFEAAYHDYASWKQMMEVIDLDRKLVESEVKIIKDMRAVLTAEDAYELTAKLLASIISCTNAMENIPDKVKLYFLKRIQYEFTRIVGDRDNKGAGGSGEEDSDSESGELD